MTNLCCPAKLQYSFKTRQEVFFLISVSFKTNFHETLVLQTLRIANFKRATYFKIYLVKLKNQYFRKNYMFTVIFL